MVASRALKEILLVDLPDTKRREVLAVHVRSKRAALKWLRDGRDVAMCGHDGALNVWRTDAGGWACEFYRFRRTVASVRVASIEDVAAWLDQWIPKLGSE